MRLPSPRPVAPRDIVATMGSSGHDDDHGHGDGHHDDDHHHEAPHYLAYDGQLPARKSDFKYPAIGSEDYYNSAPYLDEKVVENLAPRSALDRFKNMLLLSWSPADHTKFSTLAVATDAEDISLLSRIMVFNRVFKPRTYTSEYIRPNPCPEQHWTMNWRWPRFRMVNPKIPPPTDGAYSDMYHYLAYQNWFKNERKVYYETINIAGHEVNRCITKEGKYNALKNCRHLVNKLFAITREEEHNQVLLHMATTGTNAIRETPYPANFVEEKRKLYDNWLFRTRLKRPGDIL